MRPMAVLQHSKKGYQLVHRCQRCGIEKVNRIAVDTDMPDDFGLILRLVKGA